MNIQFDEIAMKHHIKSRSMRIRNALSITGMTEAIDNLDFDAIEDILESTDVADLSDIVAVMLVSGVDVLSNIDAILPWMFNALPITHVDIPSNIETIGKGAFSASWLKDIHIPDSVKLVMPQAFYNCPFLEFVKLPDNMVDIPNSCFSFCEKLTHINIPKACRSINMRAFSDCLDLRLIDLSNVEKIGAEAFKRSAIGVANLENAIIVQKSAFQDCEELSNITVSNKLRTLLEEVFLGDKKLQNIIFKGNSKDFVSLERHWDDYWNNGSFIHEVICLDKSIKLEY